MTYRLLMHKHASKFLEKCPKTQRELVEEKLELLKLSPYKHPELDIEIIQGYKDLYRLRVGQYRLIYRINNGELIIFIMLMGNRGDVYKHLQ